MPTVIRALVVFCHPSDASFTAAVRDRVLDRLSAAGADVRLTDLYAIDFRPSLSLAEWRSNGDAPANRVPVAQEVDDLLWCNTLIFVYPTWWYGLPAMLKGWLDRVLLPEVAFHLPQAEGQDIRPGLTHIERLGVFTTCGASRWLTLLVGAPGKRTLMRGIGLLCGRTRKAFAAHYLMDSSTAESRARHLDRVGRSVDRLIAR